MFEYLIVYFRIIDGTVKFMVFVNPFKNNLKV